MHLLVTLIASVLMAFPAAAQDAGVRQVTITERSVVTLNTRLRFTTMIILPQDEQLEEVICGDSDYWIISAANNIAHIKPAKQGAVTNLNLVTTAGVVYSFLLSEGDTAAPPDLKVYIARESARIAPPRPRATDTELSDLRARLDAANNLAGAAQLRADESIAAFRRQYPSRMQFAYSYPKSQKPFFVRAIWHDGQHTYIQTDARELPALYELKDGKAAMVNFSVHDGVYVVPKVLERGYLALGNKRLIIQQGR
jgi:type IV secretory pathway VirB9-like protein